VHPATATPIHAEPSHPLSLLLLDNLNIPDRSVEPLTLNRNQVCSSADRGSIGNVAIDVGSGLSSSPVRPSRKLRMPLPRSAIVSDSRFFPKRMKTTINTTNQCAAENEPMKCLLFAENSGDDEA